jgi:hypothetical protein
VKNVSQTPNHRPVQCDRARGVAAELSTADPDLVQLRQAYTGSGLAYVATGMPRAKRRRRTRALVCCLRVTFRTCSYFRTRQTRQRC